MTDGPVFEGTPLVVSVNVDIETLDAERAGPAGLYGRYSYGRYGAREGIWRLLDVFRTEAVRATFFVDPADAARHPEVIEAIAGGDHEIALYGRAMSRLGGYDEAGRAALVEGRDALAGLTGKAPSGWRSTNGLVVRETLLDLARAGFSYESSALDDDWPYLMVQDDLKLVELPVAEYLRDATFYAGHHTHERVRKVWREEFDAIRSEGGYVHLVLHTRGDHGSGRADRARVVAEFLDRARRAPGVVPMRCDEIAAACRARARPDTFLAEIVKPRADPHPMDSLPI